MSTPSGALSDSMNVPTTTGANISLTSLAVSGEGAPGTSTPSSSTLPRVTASQTPEYAHRLAEINSRATLTDPLNVLFQQEKTGRATPITPELLYLASRRRVDSKISAGSSVVETGDFAAVACWEPPGAILPPLNESQLAEIARERPVFAQFVSDNQRIQLACLGEGQPHWNLSLMARDPDRQTRGAVRAVIQPYVAKAKQEKMPIWLVAGNARARAVYAYFGFRVVDTIWSYPKHSGDGGEGEGEGVPTWCMVCNWPPG